LDAMPPVPEPSRPAERARLELSRHPVDAGLDDFFRRTCELSSEVLRVERVGVWLFLEDRSALRCSNLFERTKNEHCCGAILRVCDFPTYFSSLTIRKAVPAEIAIHEPWTAELATSYMIPLGIASMLDAGIFVDSQLVGVICHEHVGKTREWTTEQRDFAGSVADLVAARIQAAEVRELKAAFASQTLNIDLPRHNHALEQLAAGIAQDFKNLLTVFLGHGELLRLRPDIPTEVRQQGVQISTAAERGIALAEELIAFAKPNEKPPAVIDLSDLTGELMPVLQSAVGERHRLMFARSPHIGKVLVDRTQYMKVLLNLAINARDAMPDGGSIKISLRPVKITGHPSHKGRFVLLEITDPGIGMSATVQEQLFEPFFTTKGKGTGLGLAVVRQVVDRAGGLIRVESEPGRGTVVRIFFPRIEASGSGTTVYHIPPELWEKSVS
jgi:two-component system, cell cycle sensor histidine kinase and response regulator CckA